MSIDNYGQLKTAVANWLSRSSLTSRIPEFIELGEAMLFTSLRCREMEASSNVTVTSATRTSSLPTRWVAGRSVYISGSTQQRLEYRRPEEYWSVYADLTSAKPQYYTIEGGNFVWGPLPDDAYTAVVLYYQRPAVLASDSDTNDVLTRWPNLYLFSALIQAAPYLGNDPRLLTWTAMLEDLIERIHVSDRHDRASGDTVLARRAG